MKFEIPKALHAEHEELPALAGSAVRPEMAEVLPMTRRLKVELPKMLAEHKQIVGRPGATRADGGAGALPGRDPGWRACRTQP